MNVQFGRRSTDKPNGAKRLTRAFWLAVACVSAIAFGWGAGQFSGGNCDRIHTLVSYLDQVVLANEKSFRLYYEEGTINSVQLDRALAGSKMARELLAKADCQQ